MWDMPDIRDVKTWESISWNDDMVYNEYYEAMLQVYVLPWKDIQNVF